MFITHPFAAKLIIYTKDKTRGFYTLCRQQIPLDLHVLGTSPAFTLSHDQTLSKQYPGVTPGLIYKKSEKISLEIPSDTNKRDLGNAHLTFKVQIKSSYALWASEELCPKLFSFR